MPDDKVGAPPRSRATVEFAEYAKARVSAIKAKIVATGSITTEDQANLLALTRLQSLEPDAPRAHRWIPIVLFLITMSGCVILFFSHIPRASVDFEGEVSQVSFTNGAEYALQLPSSLNSLALDGAETIDLTELEPLPEGCRSQSFEAISLNAQGTTSDRGSIGIADVVVPAKSQVTVSHAPTPHSYQFTIQPPRQAEATMKATVSVVGSVQVRASGCKLQFSSVAPSQIHVDFRKGERTDLSVKEFEASRTEDLEIPISNIQLFEVQPNPPPTESNESGEPRSLRLSTVQSGTLFFDSVPDVSRKLRVEELLDFRDLKGSVRVIAATKDFLRLRFTGWVTDVRSGEDGEDRTMMPTVFEWLTSKHGLVTLGAAGLYIFGLVVGLAKWWGVRI